LILGAAAACGLLYFLYTSAVADRELLEAQFNALVERANADKAKIEQMAITAAANEKTRQEAARRMQDNIARIGKLEATTRQQEADYDELQQTLSRHDLKALVLRNPSRMQLRFGNATDKLFREFEAATARN
ncbi:MAG: hypothetical protein GY822_23150, partial [Deltaproteobacteria bacterium]|nr:hypothetical protein [Deltaproteobacteria bacterium]